ncbi:MAG: MATE family efflux transporter [Clostridium sulfidigenes]|uniref:Probable multidrug resistance protein NorM n=2 Tax=Clostridium TaxID=1485 RepID=A0A927W591_9CLOT|nr:MATE family efflux transporter [Clostridium sulfidigenes]
MNSETITKRDNKIKDSSITDMTIGNPFKILWTFSLPMLLSSLFQQLYNIVDSIVAGKFIGVNALAAVGASYPITALFIAVAVGSSMGCSVVVAQIFGSKKYTTMKSAISTAIISLTSLSIILTILGSIFCKPLMRLLHTPENIFSDSALYLQIYISGIIFLFLYNTATAIFNGLGDSKTPLYLLIFSSIFNIILDLVFVITFKMGVSGVALATFIAQGLSSILAIVCLIMRLRKIEVTEKYPYFSSYILKRISRIAIPSIMQQSFISVGQICVQGLVNSYGAIVVAGYSAAFRVHTIALTSMSTMSSALSSFTAQNIGAKKISRVREGYKAAVAITLSICGGILILFLILAPKLIGLFVDSSESIDVINVGTEFLRTLAPFYLVVGLKMVCDGVLRGAGAMKDFMFATFSDLILRVALSFILASIIGYSGIWWAFPLGWIIGTALSVYFYYKGTWKPSIN